MIKCIGCKENREESQFTHSAIANSRFICRPCNSIRTKRYREKLGSTARIYESNKAKRLRFVNKIRVVGILGRQCKGCGIKDIRILEVNHKNGNGTKELKECGGSNVLYRLIAQGKRQTNDLELLCANCNVLYEYKRGKRYLPPGFEPIELDWVGSGIFCV